MYTICNSPAAFRAEISYCRLEGRSKVIQILMKYDHRDTRLYLIAYSQMVIIRTTSLYKKEHPTKQFLSPYRAIVPLCSISSTALTYLL
jgi:hypothetical protein